MDQNLIKKEALFNEVKGSLFEYLVAKEISIGANIELAFQKSLDINYLNILSQQDRLVRQFYPEMLPFLKKASQSTANEILIKMVNLPETVKLVGKFSHTDFREEYQEADIILENSQKIIPISLKLNKKKSFVNTKSGGVKSFFQQYFPFLDASIQTDFNQFVDKEFLRMSLELHSLHDLEFPGDFSLWVLNGFSELPGELDLKSRDILKSYYARISQRMHEILNFCFKDHFYSLKASIPTLMGFGSENILQVTYFHEFPENIHPKISVYNFINLKDHLSMITLKPFGHISSVEFKVGDWELQIRIKPMNKFTTTALKVNCSTRLKQS